MAQTSTEGGFPHGTKPAAERLQETWAATVEDARQAGRHSLDYSRSALQAADRFVQGNPWKTAGAAAGIGVLLTWLATRR